MKIRPRQVLTFLSNITRETGILPLDPWGCSQDILIVIPFVNRVSFFSSMSKLKPADEGADPAQTPMQQDQPGGSTYGYSSLILQQGVQQFKKKLKPLASYVEQLDEAIATLAAVAAHQRKVGVLQLYGQG